MRGSDITAGWELVGCAALMFLFALCLLAFAIGAWAGWGWIS